MRFNKETIKTLGVSKLASGTIVSPVPFIDLPLPVGYRSFHLLFDSVLSDTVDALAAAFSFDGGVTFLADISHRDSYYFAYNAGNVAIDGITSLTGGYFGGSDGLMQLADPFFNTDATNPILPMDFELRIFPGSSVSPARIRAETSGFTGIISGYPVLTLLSGVFGVNVSAAIAPTLARANVLRLLMDGLGSADPNVNPPSAENITAGSYILWGVAPYDI